MRVRVLTLRYEEGLHGFPEEALRDACAGREVLDVREHYFIHGNVQHVSLLLLLSDEGTHKEPVGRRGKDAGDTLPEHLRPLYRSLREWRNDQARKEGIPSYVIARNVQLAEICRRLPASKAQLKEIDGIGEAVCGKYGDTIVAMVKESDIQPSPDSDGTKERGTS
mgnify:CR=1 FL=1